VTRRWGRGILPGALVAIVLVGCSSAVTSGPGPTTTTEPTTTTTTAIPTTTTIRTPTTVAGRSSHRCHQSLAPDPACNVGPTVRE